MRQYTELLREVLEDGTEYHDRTGVGRKSIFGKMLKWDISKSFPLMTIKDVYWKGVAHELLWFLGAFDEKYKKFGNTNIKYLVDHNVNIWNEWPYEKYKEWFLGLQDPDQLEFPPMSKQEWAKTIKENDKFAKEQGELGPVYGAQWRSFNGVDQIKNLISKIETSPQSSRLLVSAWNPFALKRMLLPPCHYAFQIKIYGDKMSLLWNQRSVDTFLGLPFNIASYGLLLYLIAKVTGYQPHELVFSGGDVHVYQNHYDQVEELLSREGTEPNLPTLDLDEVDNIFDFRFENIHLKNYKPLDKIKAPVAV